MIQDAFVINLDDRKDRLQDFQMQKFPFIVKRFPAIKSTNGGLGCSMSHVSVLRKHNRLPFLVFEDDALLIQDWDVVEKAMAQLPKDWDMLFLGASLSKPIKRYSDNLFHLHSAWTAHAVIYGSDRVVEYVCANAISSGLIIDTFYKNFVFPRYNCFIVDPVVVVQKGYVSDITGKMSDVSKVLLNNFDKYTK